MRHEAFTFTRLLGRFSILHWLGQLVERHDLMTSELDSVRRTRKGHTVASELGTLVAKPAEQAVRMATTPYYYDGMNEAQRHLAKRADQTLYGIITRMTEGSAVAKAAVYNAESTKNTLD